MNELFTVFMENFELILTVLVVVCLIFYIIDCFSHRRTRKSLKRSFRQGLESDYERRAYHERLMQVAEKTRQKNIPFLQSILLKLKNKEHLEERDLYWVKKPVYPMEKFIEFFSGLFWVLFIVWFVRSFFWEPFQIPSASMEPTLQNGDFILVDKHAYGYKLPVTGKVIIPTNEVKNGDVVVFKWPVDPKTNFIKRVIGIPGDTVAFKNGNVFINDKKIKLTVTGTTHISHDNKEPYYVFQEYLPDHTHEVQFKREDGVGIAVTPYLTSRYDHIRSADIQEGVPFKVPDDSYFVMGDNRDNSDDGRFWGFVPKENLVGKALFIWMNSDCVTFSGFCSRIGSKIQ